MRAILLGLISLLLPALAGCSGALPKAGILTHHVAITVDEGTCLAASRWGWLSITGDIAEAECRALVEGQRLRMWMRLQQAAKTGT